MQGKNKVFYSSDFSDENVEFGSIKHPDNEFDFVDAVALLPHSGREEAKLSKFRPF